MLYSILEYIKDGKNSFRRISPIFFFIPPVNKIGFQWHMPHNKICLYQIIDSQHCRHIFQEYFLHILQEMLSNPNYFCNFASPIKVAGCSSVRFRVLVWGASGRKFESCHPDIPFRADSSLLALYLCHFLQLFCTVTSKNS